MKKLILSGILSLAASANALAAGAFSAAHVATIRIDANGWGMVFFDVATSGTPPSCVHPSYARALAFDTNTAGGKAILAIVTSAKAQGSLIDVYGTGACSIYGSASVEDWYYGFQS